MGENLDLKEREAVRTPLQWSSRKNGGFSVCRPDELVREMTEEGDYGYARVNIDAQNNDADSLLNFIRSLIRTRRAVPDIGWGKWEVLELDSRLLGLKCSWRGNSIVTVHNLSDETIEAKIDVMEGGERLVPILTGSSGRNPVTCGESFSLAPYDFVWLRPDEDRR